MTTSYAGFQTARATAGAAYASAAAAYVAAAVELAAYDGVVSNGTVSGRQGQTATFNNLPELLAHPAYLPQAARDALTTPNVVSPAIASRTAVLIATWSGS
jgi:hypothetical protein